MGDDILKLVYQLKNKCQNRDTEIMAEYKLSQAEYSFLTSVNDDDLGSSLKISEVLGLSVSRTSRIIDRLVKNGFISRRTNKKDRRTIKLSYTKKGLELKGRIDEIRDECEQKLIDQIPEDKIGLIKEGLDLIIKNL